MGIGSLLGCGSGRSFSIIFCTLFVHLFFNWAAVPGGRFSNPPTSQSPIVISPLQTETWSVVKKLFSETTLKKGDYFIKENEIAKQIGFLQQGIIRAFYRNNEGIEYNKHFFIQNNIIGGYSSLVTSMPNKINQQALTDCKILVAQYSEIIKLYDIYPDFERVGRKLAEFYFVEKEKREIEIVLLNADARYLIFRKEYPQLEQLIPQYQIASYLGITPTQLSRIRRKFSEA
jgi:CRP-like cAMP-binding protein